MIHEAYMPVYIPDSDFHCGRAGSPEVVQEALADLKICFYFYHVVKSENICFHSFSRGEKSEIGITRDREVTFLENLPGILM